MIDRPVFPRRALLSTPLALALALILPACSSHEHSPVAPSTGGLSADYIAPVVRSLDFSRFALNTMVYDWATSGRVDAAWTFDANDASWSRRSVGYQSVFVGSPGGASTEVRSETELDWVAHFTRNGSPQQDLSSADRVALALTVREHRYAVDPGFPLDEAWDVTARLDAEMPLSSGAPGTMVASGTIAGWWFAPASEGRRVDYAGDAGLRFEFPDRFVNCPAERMAADIRVRVAGIERDRFSGEFGAAADENLYTGALVSARGPWRFAIRGDRGCPAAGMPAKVPAPLAITALP